MTIRDIDKDSPETDELPTKTPSPSAEWDGWGANPSLAATERPHLPTETAAETAEAIPANPRTDAADWDGWGEAPNARIVSGGRDVATSRPDGDTHGQDLREGRALRDVPEDRAEHGSDATMRARAAVDAAFQDVPNRSGDGEEISVFKRQVAQSEAQHVESLTEAESYARDVIGIERVDFSAFDRETANDVNATLEVLRDTYPTIKGLEYLGTIQGRNADMKAERPDLAVKRVRELAEPRPEVVAVTLRDTGDYNGIAINSRWANHYGETASAMQRDEDTGGSAKGVDSMSGVVAHEFGHLVENHLRANGQFDGELHDAVSEFASHDPIQLSRELSRYAVQNESELFAEAFAEYQMSDKPRLAARTIGNIVDNILNVQDNSFG